MPLTIVSGKRPANVFMPVISPSIAVMSSNVAGDAGLSGWVHVGEGQTSGYPLHQLPAWPGIYSIVAQCTACEIDDVATHGGGGAEKRSGGGFAEPDLRATWHRETKYECSGTYVKLHHDADASHAREFDHVRDVELAVALLHTPRGLPELRVRLRFERERLAVTHVPVENLRQAWMHLQLKLMSIDKGRGSSESINREKMHDGQNIVLTLTLQKARDVISRLMVLTVSKWREVSIISPRC